MSLTKTQSVLFVGNGGMMPNQERNGFSVPSAKPGCMEAVLGKVLMETFVICVPALLSLHLLAMTLFFSMQVVLLHFFLVTFLVLFCLLEICVIFCQYYFALLGLL